jgi:site-specific DNA recombinase
MLQNPVYMGYVKKISYYDEPSCLVKALHSPIITEDDWWRVQAIFQNKNTPRRSLSEDFPLRGVLKCFCNRNYTAAFSKGKKILVGYYKCNTHTGNNLNAKRIHRQFDELLVEMSLPKLHVDYLQQKIMDNVNQQLAGRRTNIENIYQQLASLEKKISGVEDKYFENKIDDSTYSKWKKLYHADRSVLTGQLKAFQEPIDQVWQRYDQTIGNLANLQWIYSISTTEEKQSFIREVFDNRLSYYENIYRTPYLMDIFQPKPPLLTEKRLLIDEQPPL